MNLDLEGRVALVTGAARDVGREIALVLAAEGAAIAVNYRRSADEAQAVVETIKSRGGNAMACGADVADYAAVKAMVAEIVAKLGGLNVLVNNAGLALRRRFVETTPAEWRHQIDVCLYGTIHCCHAAAPHLEAAGNGRIISVVGDFSLGLVETAHDREWLEANRERLTKLYPLRRLGRPSDVAPTVALLASDHGGWITGQVISISGGFSMVG